MFLFFSTANLALNGTAFISEVDVGGEASRGVDGVTNQDYYNDSCFHGSGTAANQWWAVDLGKKHPVSTVRMYNREDGGNCKSVSL